MGSGGSKAQKGHSGTYRIKRLSIISDDANAQVDESSLFKDIKGVVYLPRGGYVVKTRSCGPVQFGIPPETVKDSLDGGLEPPCYYVVAGKLQSIHRPTRGHLSQLASARLAHPHLAPLCALNHRRDVRPRARFE